MSALTTPARPLPAHDLLAPTVSLPLTHGELQALWSLCSPFRAETFARELEAKGIDAELVEEWGLASECSEGLALPLYGAQDALEGLCAWNPSKELAPHQVGPAGLVLACPLARQVLKGELAALSWWKPTARVVLIAPGASHFLRCATQQGRFGDAEGCLSAPAVLGLSFSWSEALSARIAAAGCRAILQGHDAAWKREAFRSLQGHGVEVLLQLPPDAVL